MFLKSIVIIAPDLIGKRFSRGQFLQEGDADFRPEVIYKYEIIRKNASERKISMSSKKVSFKNTLSA